MIKLVNRKHLEDIISYYFRNTLRTTDFLEIIAMNLMNIRDIQFSIRNCIMIAHSVPNALDMYTNKFSLLGLTIKIYL